jgi:hypothetical protein
MAAQFERSVERWRKPLEKLADWVPLDFLLAWVDKESNGLPHVVSSIGERGLFQVHKDEVPYLKLSEAEFQKLTKDTALALKTGVKQAKLYANFSKKFLAEVRVEWHGQDFWKLVKLHHAAFAMPRYTLLAFKREHGRGPASWDELYKFATKMAAEKKDLIPDKPKFSARLRGLTAKTFKNADTVGSVVPAIAATDLPALRTFFRLLAVA